MVETVWVFVNLKFQGAWIGATVDPLYIYIIFANLTRRRKNDDFRTQFGKNKNLSQTLKKITSIYKCFLLVISVYFSSFLVFSEVGNVSDNQNYSDLFHLKNIVFY